MPRLKYYNEETGQWESVCSNGSPVTPQTIGAVLYTAQNLTEEQKAQARANIGATAVKMSLDNGVLSIE